MSGTAYARERVIRVEDIDPRHRHTVIRQLFEHLPQGGSLQLVVDHDPKHLRFLLEAPCSSCCEWTCIEKGPPIWRVRLRRWASGS
jgi:uncharacterized protein (DUF2249 family)